MTSLKIKTDALSDPMRDLVAALGEHYPILDGELAVTLEPGAPAGSFEIKQSASGAVILYDTPAQACRGIGTLLAGLGDTREETSFTTLGIMLDCSRNAVMTVEHFKGWLRQLALLGYNMAMLYTEDTYELPGEEYFGYQRGRFSAAEFREVDQYASRLGIEMIGCIQTLGHLEQILKWPAYFSVKDTASVLLVDEEKTYELIEKMIVRIAECFGTRRIHIGMDETADLGRGRLMDARGYEPGTELFTRHLGRVMALCEKHGLKPMLWSDMFFRLGSQTMDYNANSEVPEEMKRKIPSNVELVYWDYYHDKQDYYAEMIRKHRALGIEPLMASGVWTWSCLWYLREKTEANVPPCVAACREAGVKELFFTMWGDDGAYCELDSALAGLAFSAEHAYASDHAAARFAAICGADYEEILAVAELNVWPNPVLLLWDDPLLRVAWQNEKLKNPGVWKETSKRYARIGRRIRSRGEVTAPVDIAHAGRLLAFLKKKIAINEQLDARAFGEIKIKPVLRALDELHDSFRRQWFARNKPQGFDTIQVRLGGQRQRYLELARRLEELAAGRIESIPELDEQPTAPLKWTPGNWRQIAVAGIL